MSFNTILTYNITLLRSTQAFTMHIRQISHNFTNEFISVIFKR